MQLPVKTRILHFVAKGHAATTKASVEAATVYLLAALSEEPEFRFQWSSVQGRPRSFQLTVWTKLPDDAESIELLGVILERS